MDEDEIEEDMFSLSYINLMETLPKIINQDKENFKLTPSEFIKQMTMTLEDRHKFLVGLTLKQKSMLKNYPPQFKVIPGLIVFQRFETLSTNYVTLEVRNVGKISVGIKMRCPESMFFSAGFASRPLTKLAPGLNVEYKIAFTPQEQRDYRHHLVFVSNDCTFKVPIIAIGPRPLLDIPDQIILDPAPVKIPINKFIVVRNIGESTAVFNFSSGSKHFHLSPGKGILAPNDSLMLNITFLSNKVKEVKEIIYLMYETGEKLQIMLHGSADNVSIRLDKNSIALEDTFINLRRCKTIHLINNSSSIVKFSWKKNKSEEDDLEIIKSMREKYKEITELEILKDTKVTYFGFTSHENHKLSCERILQDELKILEKEEFLFSDEVFTLIPESGEVWPKDSKEIMVSFSPKVCGPASAEAFLEVTGRDSRLPLKLKGSGLGPDISINVKTLDIDYIYLCSLHRYEVIIENRGDIPGTMEYIPEPLVFGGKIEVNPQIRTLKPYELGLFVLTYTSNRPGDFTEKLNFIIKESEKEISLVLKGKIVCPTLHFDKKDINFGAVPFGISITREATLNNLSVVPVTFSLRVSPDGAEPSVSYDEFAKFTTKPSIPQFPKEFEVDPEESVVEPYSSKKVKVTVTANKVGSFRKVLIVDMWDSENGSVSCPIFYRVEVANLVGDPDLITIPFCFINYPYTRSITVKNLSHVAGLFYIVPLQPSPENPVTYTTSLLQGVIPPHRSIKIDVTLLISAVGRQVFPISMVTFGSDLPQEMCTISCLGQGPIINVEPASLTWGQVPLLTSSEKVVHLTNVSPIPANLEISLAKSNCFWTVSHPQLKVLPEETAKLVVTLHLNECGKFKDALKVTTYNGKDILVPLAAAGVGSSLLMTPRITPLFDLGTLFCHKKYEFPITVENKGTKSYGLLWSPYLEYKTFVNAKFSLPEDSMFRIEPIKMDVLPGETKIMTVAAHSKTLGYYTQTFYCFANSGSPTKKLHYTTEISAKFVGPTISFDKEEINFWHYTGADGREEKLHDTIVIKNVSVLPVQVQVTTPSPFCLVSESGGCVNTLRVILEGFGKKEINLKFLAPQNVRKYFKVYTAKLVATMNDTSKTSSVILRGEVSYPNITIKPNKVDFRYVKVGTNACIEVNLLNTSPLTVYYEIKWKKQLCQVTQIEKQLSGQIYSEKAKDPLEETEKEVSLESDKGDTDSMTIGTPLSAHMLSLLNPPEKPTIKMPEVTISDADAKTLLFNLTRRYYDHNSEVLDVYKTARPFCIQRDDGIAGMCNKYCVITPFYGKLEPFCSQSLYIGFYSDAPVKIHLEAMVLIRAGPTELLTIDAISGDINYRLSATELDFGKQLFCETQSQALKIRNTSDMPFTYETYTGKAECEESEHFSLGHGVVTISPSSGTLSSFQTAELVVRYHPGVPGKFETFFRLRIGHLNPIVIKVRGIGVFPQVHIFLPRTEILKIPPETGYLAVASITPDWILTEYGSGTCIYDLNQLKPYRSRENSLCNFVETEPNGESWEVIKAQEFTPSEIDIHLAIERILAYDLIAEDANTSFAVYARTIPRFVVPGYDLDFGVCAVGRTVEKQMTVMNFGPLPVILYGIFGLNLKEEGIHVRLKNRNELKVGSCLPFTVAFTPKRSKYKKKYEMIKSLFYFEIYHGPKIPIRISAEVTYPHVQPSMFLINFREVICGQCKIINLRLKNPGLVRARWTFVFKPEIIYHGSSGEPSNMRPMFSVDCSTGVLNPSEYCTIQVSFKPLCGNSFSTYILVQVAKSLETLKIQLLGTGIEPKLYISSNSLNFSAALPYPNKDEAIFFVENPSPFPVEFYFPEFDEQSREEERILRAIGHYYQTDELLLPVRRPGDGLPVEIVQFYNMLIDNLNAKFMEEERGKMLERDSPEEGTLLLEDDSSTQDVEGRKRKRAAKKTSRSGSALDASREFASGTSIKEPVQSTIFDKKSSCEIEEMLEDFIKNNFMNENKFDPLQAALRNSIPPVVVQEEKEGTLIICHGAPYTNPVLLSSRLAISLNTTALSIDRIILSEAALGRCEAGNLAREMIEQAYWEHMELEKREPTPFEVWGESSQPSEVLPYDENLEELQRKCKIILEKRENSAKGKVAMPATAKSETSKKIDKASPSSKIPPLVTNAITSTPILPDELIFELLRYRMALEMRNSLVIEGLDSMLIDSPTKALVTLLKAAGNAKDIIVVFFLSDYVHYIQNMTIRHSEQELAKSYLREEILNVLEEEPDEVVKSLNLEEEDEEAFRAFYLAKRHEAQNQFEKRRENFYDSKEQKALSLESHKQPEQGSSLHLTNTSQMNITSSKKIVFSRRTEPTGPTGPTGPTVPFRRKISEVNWKQDSELMLGKNKRLTLESEFLSFHMDLIEMRAIIENWDQKLGAVVVDSAPDVKSKKGQTPRKVESNVVGKQDDNKRGVFMWLVDVSRSRSNTFLACCNYLKGVLENRNKVVESDNWPVQESDEGTTFSVVYLRPKRTPTIPQNVFILTPIYSPEMMGEYDGEVEYSSSMMTSFPEKLLRSGSSLSVKTKKKAPPSRRGKIDSKTSVETKATRKPSFYYPEYKSVSRGRSSVTTSPKSQTTMAYTETPMKSRWVLGPGEKQMFRVRYYPTEMGTWEHKYIIKLVSWDRKETIHCYGVCDIPRINTKPEFLFPAVEHFRPLTSRFYPAFYYSLNAYDFGAIILLQAPDGRRITKKTAVLNLQNISTLPVDLSVIIDEDETEEQRGNECIIFEPSRILIEPGEKKKLLVSACPTKYGPMSKVLLLVIKNNPLVEKITLLFEGVKACVSISPKVVNFDRQLLQRRELRNMVFTNDNTLELYACIRLPENFPPQFTFSHRNLWLPPSGSFSIEVHYIATEVQIVNEKPVLVQIYDSQDKDEPVQELTFYVNAEAYDAALDVIFTKTEADHVDFGDIRVENHYSIEFYLKNVGKYLLAYMIEIDNEFISPDAEDIQVAPQMGRLLPGKLTPITVSLCVQKEVSWKRLPFIKISLVEPFYGDEIIALIPITVSARSHYSRYEIKPSNRLNFGHIQVGTLKTASLLIENKGLFSLTYMVDFRSAVSEGSPESSKFSGTEKNEKTKKGVSPMFKAGIFEISPATGTVEPKQVAVLKVNALPLEVKNHEENIIIYIDESLPHLRNGNQLTISAQACLPKIGFQDHKHLFREHHICKDEAELSTRNKLGSYTVFVEKNKTFFFKNICVNSTAEARIHLENIGLIDCTVLAGVKPSAEEEGGRKSIAEGGSRVFGLSPEKLIVEPYTSASILLTFKPEALEVYKAQVVITLPMPDGHEDEVWVFRVCGNGIFPLIEITEPNTKLPEGQYLVNFAPISPGHTSSSSIAFANTGLLDCKVIMELYKFQNGIFTLMPKPGTENKIKIWNPMKPIDHTAVVVLSPGEVAEFCVYFNPKEVQNYTSQLKLFIVDNPFENWCFKLTGDVFFEEVVIEKIRTELPFFVEDEGPDKSAIPVAPGQYSINFTECYVNKKTKILIRLSNKTQKDYFRFEWDEVPTITLSPNVGHLYPNSFKEVLLVFLPTEPVEFEDFALACKLNKIFLDKPPEPSWDSRMVQYQMHYKQENISARSSDKVSNTNVETMKTTTEEPAHEIIPESSKMLYIHLSGLADYARLICPVSKIFFKSTYMFQNRIYPLVLENPGNVPLDYKIGLKSVTVWPLKINKRSQVDEGSLLKAIFELSRPKTAVPESDCSWTKLFPCNKSRRPTTAVASVTQEVTLDDCEQEPVQSYKDEDKPYFNPFTVENAIGRILPKEKTSCNIVFSPMDTNEYKAVLSIQVEYLHPECILPEIEVTASSVMPYCHFDVPESDYLESGRRDYSRPGPVGYAPGVPLNPETKTIEVKVIGIGTTVPIKFHVINPTEEDYSFSWVNNTQVQPGVVPSFHCSTLGGQIRAGRQQLMVFNFKSQKVGITESFWKFSIPEHDIETPFLLVGDARDPAIYFLSNYVSLRPMLVGTCSSEILTLVNNEDIPFDYHFIPESFYSEGRQNLLRVEPKRGTVAPNSEVNIRVTFVGRAPGKVTFKVKCKVKSIKEPFTIPVEAVTYLVQPVLVFEDLKKVKHTVDVNKENIIDFGSELNPNIPETITVNITNLSKITFTYEWEYDYKALDIRNCKMVFSPASGQITSSGKTDISIVFSKRSSISNFPVKLKIKRGPTFHFRVRGTATVPLCELSFYSYDFGFCFLQTRDICFNETTLILRNRNDKPLFLECSLPEQTAFSFSLKGDTVPARGEMEINIRFHPKECISYTSDLKLVFNGNRQRTILLTGQGTDLKVVLAEAEDLTISLGAVRVGKSSTRKFRLLNESLATATLLVGFSDQFPVNGQLLVSPEKHHIDLSQGHKLTGLLTISPSTVFRIKPQESFTISVTYTPRERSPPFSETVSFQCQETVEPLCVLTGCCLAPNISLDRKAINFGAVVKSCGTDMRLKLVNSGSVGASFEWMVQGLAEYQISPVQGYCSPESEVTINVTFLPNTVQSCIKRMVECVLRLPDNEEHPSLWLELIGDCVALPQPKEVLVFECHVRETTKKTLEIENPSGSEWQLVPVISGEYFKTFDVLFVPALSTAEYEVEYSPLMMSHPNFHKGSVFFKLPSGQGLLYHLKGIALPPRPEETITREVPCKTKYVELLKIKNWLQYPQRFLVKIVSTNRQDDPTVTCTGLEYLEVHGLIQKDYSLNFFAYNVGTYEYNIHFLNETTNEYIWFEVTFKVHECGPLKMITLKSGVRQLCQYELKLENPLSTPIRYEMKTSSPDVRFDSVFKEVPPESSAYVILSYVPIHPGELIESLTASCPELGLFPWDLRLVAADLLPGPATTFETSLGSADKREISVQNIAPTSALLICKVDSDAFRVNEHASVASGESHNIEVTYEPSEIGSSTATLTVQSDQAGNFTFPLVGFCSKPLAKGPYILKPGGWVTIPFKNIFKTSKEFHMYVDNPAFVLKTTQESLSAKEECKISVGLQKMKNLETLPEYSDTEIIPKFPMMGQLIVECLNPYVKWQFYLKGVLEK